MADEPEIEPQWKRRVGADATHHGVLLRNEADGEWLIRMHKDGATSEDPKDRFGPFPIMSGWIEWAIPVVGDPLWRDTHPEDS